MAALSTMPNGPHVIAGDQGSSNNMLLTCYGKAGMQILYQYPEGAWGATPEKDGESALFSIVGNCLNMPAEALELKFPIRLKRYELRADSGGDGKYRGGLGTRRDYEILSDVAELSFVADRCKFGAKGFDGGGEGRARRISDRPRRWLPTCIARFRIQGCRDTSKKGGYSKPADGRRRRMGRPGRTLRSAPKPGPRSRLCHALQVTGKSDGGQTYHFIRYVRAQRFELVKLAAQSTDWTSISVGMC